ncbi:MAG: AsmA family protein [Halioglobus sp.]|nr:AsmA family protein [Halioglobus sp.]
MKRIILILLGAVALVGLAAALGGNRLVANALDARLAPLLTRQLGLPVTIAPVEAYALSLRAKSARLVMGDPADPAVVATRVDVRLSWPALLTGTVRIVSASADDLLVNPGRWPDSNSPPPDNYRFLDQWLPADLAFNTGRYVTGSDDAYPVQDLHWRRQLVGSSVRINWQEQRQGGLVKLEAELVSLEDLLNLNDLQLSLTGAIDEVDTSRFKLAIDVRPDTQYAYTVQGTLNAIDSTLTTTATGSQRWSWPDASQSKYTDLNLGKLVTFFNVYSAPNDDETTESFLARTLPDLHLVQHKGSLTIDTIELAGEIVRNAQFDFEVDNHGVHIEPMSLDAPEATLRAALKIDNLPTGWNVSLDAKLHARKGNSIAQAFVGSEWIWETGNANVKGHGKTWGGLLYSLQGHVAADGHHRGKVNTPVTVEAVLASNPGQFDFDHLQVSVGDGHFHGSAKLSGEEQHTLTLDLTGNTLHINFLFDSDEGQPGHGVAIPEYLNVLPSVDLDWTLSVTDLHAPGLSLAKAHARLERYEEWGKLVVGAVGVTGGTLDIDFSARLPAHELNHYDLKATIQNVDLPAMFQQPNVFHSRSSGTLHFVGDGENLTELFNNLEGTTHLTVEVRPDNDWQRAAQDDEKLALDGAGRFVIEGTDIVGISLKNLDIESTEQDLTGTLSMVGTRSPWLIADLQSKKLDVYGLLDLLPKSSQAADQTDFLQSMRNLGAAQLSLEVDSLTLGDAPVSSFTMHIETQQGLIRLEDVALLTQDSQVKGKGEVSWRDTEATLDAEATLTNVNLDQFLLRNPELKPVPVNGSVQLSSHGETLSELAANFTGHIDLASSDRMQPSGDPSRQLLMTTHRLKHGVQADVKTLRLLDNYLTGTVRYTRGEKPLLDINITDGHFSLAPWETDRIEEDEETTKKAAQQQDAASSGIHRLAATSAKAVGSVLRMPFHMLSGNENTSKERLFSEDPLPLGTLRAMDLNLRVQMELLESSLLALHDLKLNGTMHDGVLGIKGQTGNLNGGTAKANITFDAKTPLPELVLQADFNDVRGLTSDNTYTRSGFVSFTAQGASTAALAGSLNGLIYLDLGPGPFDYRNAAILSSSIASQVFNTLIPGSTQQVPQLECGITVGEFKDGKGKTPYGYAIRTNQANLLGHLDVNLQKETMQLDFESRSREGVGLSVGNVISNSIEVRGSILDPYIVPRATSLAWRGWAAFMTGGLSLVAESVLKRALASENPCPPIQKLIREEMCPTNPIAASSPMMCPEDQVAKHDRQR